MYDISSRWVWASGKEFRVFYCERSVTLEFGTLFVMDTMLLFFRPEYLDFA